MENAPIRPAVTPPSANASTRAAGARPGPGAELAESQDPGGFSQLLAGLAATMQEESTEPLTVGSAALSDQAPLSWADAGIFSLASLVGQTARMDGAADAALRDGSRPADGARASAALPMGAGRLAAGAHFQPQAQASVSAPSRQSGAAETAAAPGQASTLTDTATATATATLALTPAAGAERTASAPGLAALLSHMEAVAPTEFAGLAVASAPSASGPSAAAGAATPVPGMEAGATEPPSAAAEALQDAASADGAGVPAAPDEALLDTLSQQVAFWVQQKTQRAEMTIDRQGQPVQVQVTLTGNEAQVTFRSSEQQTRDMLDSSTAQLRELLAEQGLNLAGVTVQSQSAGQSHTGGFAGQDPQRPGVRAARGERAQIATVAVDAPALPARAGGARTVDLFV